MDERKKRKEGKYLIVNDIVGRRVIGIEKKNIIRIKSNKIELMKLRV